MYAGAFKVNGTPHHLAMLMVGSMPKKNSDALTAQVKQAAEKVLTPPIESLSKLGNT